MGVFISYLMRNHFRAVIQMQLSLLVESLTSVVHNDPMDHLFYAGHCARCVNVVPDCDRVGLQHSEICVGGCNED